MERSRDWDRDLDNGRDRNKDRDIVEVRDSDKSFVNILVTYGNKPLGQ